MQWKLGTSHKPSYNAINTTKKKSTQNLKAPDKATRWQAVQCSTVCLQEWIFLLVFNLDLKENTHEDCSTTPENASFSYTLSGGCKKAVGFSCLVNLFPLKHTLRSFITLLRIHFCISLLPFIILVVLVPKYSFPVFYHISSKSINKPPFVFPCVPVPLQTFLKGIPIKSAGTRVTFMP